MLIIAGIEGAKSFRFNIPINRTPVNASGLPIGHMLRGEGDLKGSYVIGEDNESVFLFKPDQGVLIEVGKISKQYGDILAAERGALS